MIDSYPPASPTAPDSIFDRPPPASLEAETAVLGGMLIDQEAVTRATDHIDDTSFYREGNRRLYRAMIRIFQRGDVIDPITVAEELKNTGELEAAGGLDYLGGLVDAVPTAANVEYHAKIVREKALLRRLVEQSNAIIRDAHDPGEATVQEILDQAESRIFQVAETHQRGGFARVKVLLYDAMERIELRQQSGSSITGVPTGFSKLDNLTSGLQSGDLVIVAARPSMGKTSWVLNTCAHAAITEKAPVAIFSLEMSKEQLVERLLCAEGRIDLQKLRHRALTQEEHQRLARAAGHLDLTEIWIDDQPGATVLEMRAKCRRLQSDLRREGRDLKMVAVDYIQLMSGHGKSDNRQQEVSDISRGLKALARELGVPIVALSQLSRGPEQRTEKRPMLSDLRESGAIEQDADLVMFLYREEYYLLQQGKIDEADRVKGQTDLIVAKQRNGPTGLVPLYFEKAYTRFETREPDASPAGPGPSFGP